MEKLLAVYVHIQDRRLREALSVVLKKLPAVAVPIESGQPLSDVDPLSPHKNGRGQLVTAVVTSARDVSPVICGELARRGLLVVILAPVFREKDRAAYINAGACDYIEMDVSNEGLLEAVHRMRLQAPDTRAEETANGIPGTTLED